MAILVYYNMRSNFIAAAKMDLASRMVMRSGKWIRRPPSNRALRSKASCVPRYIQIRSV